jgi:hypothetical protein
MPEYPVVQKCINVFIWEAYAAISKWPRAGGFPEKEFCISETEMVADFTFRLTIICRSVKRRKHTIQLLVINSYVYPEILLVHSRVNLNWNGPHSAFWYQAVRL